MRIKLLLFLTTIWFVSCNIMTQKTTSRTSESEKTVQDEDKTNATKKETTEIVCDSVYKDKGYRITLTKFDTDNEGDETRYNSIFKIYKLKDGQYILIHSDSIFYQFQEVKFEDFNNDNIKDILVQNNSDARSNLSYYLFLVDDKKDQLTRIKGFENIKNPHFLPKYNWIDNYVCSGQNWTSFYEIIGDTVIDKGIVIYDDLTEQSTYRNDYKKALTKLLKEKKTTR